MYKILIIDDEKKHLQATGNYLTSQGFIICMEISPENALTQIANKRPDLIILDVIMPKLNGYQFIKQLKLSKNLKNIPFIFLTAKGLTQDRIKGYHTGCSAYLSKPFNPDELTALIRSILESKERNLRKTKSMLHELKYIRLYLGYKYKFSERVIKRLNLTTKETKILKLIIQGSKNREIASELKTGIRNVEKYVTRLFYKSGTKNKKELIKLINSNTIIIKANDGNRTRE